MRTPTVRVAKRWRHNSESPAQGENCAGLYQHEHTQTKDGKTMMEVKRQIKLDEVIAECLREEQSRYLANGKPYLEPCLEDNVRFWLRILKTVKQDKDFSLLLTAQITRIINEYKRDGETPTIQTYYDCILDCSCIEERGFRAGLWEKKESA